MPSLNECLVLPYFFATASIASDAYWLAMDEDDDDDEVVPAIIFALICAIFWPLLLVAETYEAIINQLRLWINS